jgi:hypothetical protein
MIEVELPDGTIAEFPDGTSNDVIKGALRKRFASPASSQPDEASPQGGGFLKGVDDAVRGMADMASFGFSDEIAATLGSWTGIGGNAGDYEGNVQAERARDAEGGLPRLGGQVAGALLSPLKGAKTLGGAVLQGSAMGGAYGLGSGDEGDRLKSAGLGAAVGGAAGGVLHKVADAFIGRAGSKAIPTGDELKGVSQAGYEAAEQAGVILKPEGVRKLATDVVGDLAQFGYHPQLQPRIGAVLGEMERLAQGNVTYKGMDVLRRIASSAGSSQDPSERAIATKIIQRIDDYMANLPADDVLTGNAAQASAGIKQGRDNWARFKRNEMVDTARIKAERRADSSGTGGNLDNTIRQNVRAILDNPRRSRGMTAAEKEMAEKVVRGTGIQNALRMVGKLSPTTGGLSAAMNVGATALNPLMAIPGALGAGAKVAADRMTIKNANALSELIRSGGSTAKNAIAEALKGKGSPELLSAIERIRSIEGAAVPSMAKIAAALAGQGR